MGMLTKEEKKELLALAHSAKLREDFNIIEKNHSALFIKKGKVNLWYGISKSRTTENRPLKLSPKAIFLDDYIEFLKFCNAFINHKEKTFKKIQGDNFRL